MSEQQIDQLESIRNEFKQAQAYTDRYAGFAFEVVQGALSKGKTTVDQIKSLNTKEISEAQTQVSDLPEDASPEDRTEATDHAAELSFALEIKKFEAYLYGLEPAGKNGIDLRLDEIQKQLEKGQGISDEDETLLQNVPACIVKYRCPSIPEDTYNQVKGEIHSDPKVNEAFDKAQEQFIRDVAEIEASQASYEIPFDSPVANILVNVREQIEAFNRPDTDDAEAQAYYLQATQNDETKIWTVHIRPNSTRDNPETNIASIDYSGQEDTTIRTNNIAETQNAVDSIKEDLIQETGALNTLFGAKLQETLKTAYDQKVDTIISEINDAQTVESPPSPDPEPEPAPSPKPETPSLATINQQGELIRENPDTDSDEPPVKALVDRQQNLANNPEQVVKDLQEIKQAITELTAQLKKQGVGEVAIANADAVRSFGPHSNSIEDIAANGLLDLTSQETINNGDLAASSEAIKKYPKLAQELADYHNQLYKLTQELPPEVIEAEFPGLMEKLYPDGIPEGEAPPPPPKSAVERKAYYESNKESIDSQLAELDEAIRELSKQIQQRGIGQIALERDDAVRQLGPKDADLIDLIDQDLPVLSTLTPQAIHHSPELSRELAASVKALNNLVQELPKDVIDQHFPDIFDKTYPDGIPETPPTSPTETPPTPPDGDDKTTETVLPISTTEGEGEIETETITIETEEPESRSTPESYPRYEDSQTTVNRQDFENNPKLQELVTQSQEIIDELSTELSDLDPSSILDEIAETVREVGKYSKPENSQDPLYQATQQALRQKGVNGGGFLLAIDYLKDKTVRQNNQQAIANWQANFRQKFGTNASRRSLLASVEQDLITDAFSFADNAAEMNVVKEDRNKGYQDLRVVQLVSDHLLDTYDPTARERWANADKTNYSPESVSERQAYQELLFKIMTGAEIPAEQLELAQQLQAKLNNFKQLSPQEAIDSYQGILATDKANITKSILRWRDKHNTEPYSTSEVDVMLTKGLFLILRRADAPPPLEPTKDTFATKTFVEKPPEDFDTLQSTITESSGEGEGDTEIVSPVGSGEGEGEGDTEIIEPEPIIPTSLKATVAAAKGDISRDDHQGSDLLFKNSADFAHMEMAEPRRKWKLEETPNWAERQKQRISTIAERVWRGTFGYMRHWQKEQSHGMKLFATLGIEGQIPKGIMDVIDSRARASIETQRDNFAKRIGGGLADFYHELRGNERQLHKQRLIEAEKLRADFDANPHDTSNPLHDVVWGDYYAQSKLAERIGETDFDETLRQALGEKRSRALVKLGESEAGVELKNQINRQVFRPLIESGLANNGTVDKAAELKARQNLTDIMMSKNFQDWRDSLDGETQVNIDVSLSYASNIVDVMLEQIPTINAAKEHFQDLETLDLEIELTLGTARFGPNGEVAPTSWGEKRVDINRETWQILSERGTKIASDATFRGSTRKAMWIATANAGLTSEFSLGMIAGGLTALAPTLARGATAIGAGSVLSGPLALAAPSLVAGAVAGTVAGFKEHAKLGRMRQQLDIEQALGYERPQDAVRTVEVARHIAHQVEMSKRATRLTELSTKTDLDGTDVIELMGLIADSDARVSIGETRNINLLKVDANTNSQAMHIGSREYQTQNTAHDIARARAKVALRQAITANETIRNELSSQTGQDFSTDEAVNNYLTGLTQAQKNYLENGLVVPDEYKAIFTQDTNLHLREVSSVKAKNEVFSKWQKRAAVSHGLKVGAVVTTLGLATTGAAHALGLLPSTEVATTPESFGPPPAIDSTPQLFTDAQGDTGILNLSDNLKLNNGNLEIFNTQGEVIKSISSADLNTNIDIDPITGQLSPDSLNFLQQHGISLGQTEGVPLAPSAGNHTIDIGRAGEANHIPNINAPKELDWPGNDLVLSRQAADGTTLSPITIVENPSDAQTVIDAINDSPYVNLDLGSHHETIIASGTTQPSFEFTMTAPDGTTISPKVEGLPDNWNFTYDPNTSSAQISITDPATNQVTSTITNIPVDPTGALNFNDPAVTSQLTNAGIDSGDYSFTTSLETASGASATTTIPIEQFSTHSHVSPEDIISQPETGMQNVTGITRVGYYDNFTTAQFDAAGNMVNPNADGSELGMFIRAEEGYTQINIANKIAEGTGLNAINIGEQVDQGRIWVIGQTDPGTITPHLSQDNLTGNAFMAQMVREEGQLRVLIPDDTPFGQLFDGRTFQGDRLQVVEVLLNPDGTPQITDDGQIMVRSIAAVTGTNNGMIAIPEETSLEVAINQFDVPGKTITDTVPPQITVTPPDYVKNVLVHDTVTPGTSTTVYTGIPIAAGYHRPLEAPESKNLEIPSPITFTGEGEGEGDEEVIMPTSVASGEGEGEGDEEVDTSPQRTSLKTKLAKLINPEKEGNPIIGPEDVDDQEEEDL